MEERRRPRQRPKKKKSHLDKVADDLVKQHELNEKRKNIPLDPDVLKIFEEE
jgi:hypothetical protein